MLKGLGLKNRLGHFVMAFPRPDWLVHKIGRRHENFTGKHCSNFLSWNIAASIILNDNTYKAFLKFRLHISYF